MKGAKTVDERRELAQLLKGVFAVSAYLMSCFEEGLNQVELGGLVRHITPHGVDLAENIKTLIPAKNKTIVITGRMVPEKGMREAAQALQQILPDHPDWSGTFYWAKSFAKADATPYEKEIAEILAPLGDQAQSLGFVPLEIVRPRTG